MAELRPITHQRVDVEHGPFANKNVPAEGHRSDLDPPGLRAVAEEDRIPADYRSCADREEIGTHGDVPREDHNPRPDLRAQGPQIQPIQRRTDEQMDARIRPDQSLDDPEAEIGKALETNLLGLPATDDPPLRDYRNGAHDEECEHGGSDRRRRHVSKHATHGSIPMPGNSVI